LAFSFFIIMIARAFDRLKQARKLAEDRSREWYFWLLSAALFSNLVAFFGVNYYDQSKASWFLLLAIISAATVPALPQAVASKAAGLATRNGLTSWQPKRPRLEKSQFQSI
jgi:Trk-type K+ transport system membrane component